MFNRRHIERFDMELKSTLLILSGGQMNETLHLCTRNISSAGAFLLTSNPLGVGTRVNLLMFLPLMNRLENQGKKTLLEVAGSVIRSDSEGMAVSFVDDIKLYSIAGDENR
jgi:hypothetical protein